MFTIQWYSMLCVVLADGVVRSNWISVTCRRLSASSTRELSFTCIVKYIWYIMIKIYYLVIYLNWLVRYIRTSGQEKKKLLGINFLSNIIFLGSKKFFSLFCLNILIILMFLWRNKNLFIVNFLFVCLWSHSLLLLPFFLYSYTRIVNLSCFWKLFRKSVLKMGSSEIGC